MISELPSGSRTQNIGGTGPPNRVTGAPTTLRPRRFGSPGRALDTQSPVVKEVAGA
jgi:hypothetical protein